MKTTVSMNAEGYLLVPHAARQELRLSGTTEFEMEISQGRIILKATTEIPAEDAWAYTPEHLRLVQKALQDAKAGRVRHLNERDLDQIAEQSL